VAAAGGGAAAIVVGGVLALNAKSDYGSVASDCTARGCNQEGFDVRNSARSRADVATVFMAGGAAAVVAGGLAWWLAPAGHGGAQAFVGPRGVGVVGRF